MSSFLDGAKGAAKKASEAAQKGAAAAQDKMQEMQLKRKLNAASAELGQVVYRQREGETGLDAEVDRLVSEMRGLRAEIDALEESSSTTTT
jgi:metal-dependent amidase/aminoacylase/carboxypeptidase family protein